MSWFWLSEFSSSVFSPWSNALQDMLKVRSLSGDAESDLLFKIVNDFGKNFPWGMLYLSLNSRFELMDVLWIVLIIHIVFEISPKVKVRWVEIRRMGTSHLWLIFLFSKCCLSQEILRCEVRGVASSYWNLSSFLENTRTCRRPRQNLSSTST